MSDLVELRGGQVTTTAAVEIGCDLEARGHALSMSADGKLLVSRRSELTADDVAAITANVRHLRVLAAYQAPEP